MNKFIAVVSERVIQEELVSSQKAAQRVLAVLRQAPRKVVPLLPHVVLFEFEGDRQAACKLLSAGLNPEDQLILFEIVGDYSGVSEFDAHQQLVNFFSR